MIKRPIALLIITAVLSACVTHRTATDHALVSPITGTWVATLPNGCVEKETYLSTGLVSGTSGSEYTEEKYTITPTPDINGFYKLTGFTLKDTGGPDCSGSSEDHTGKEWSAYILFSKDQKKFMECSEPNTDTCWGPYAKESEKVTP